MNIFLLLNRLKPLLLFAVYCAAVLYGSGCGRQAPVPAASPQSKITPADTFSVAFYNVENLFDDEFDGDEYPEYRPNATNWNREMQDRKFDNLSSAIAALNATIISLCEIEDRDALGMLQSRLREKGVRYDFSAMVDSPRKSNTAPALLSRLPIRHYSSHPIELPDSAITRDILEADLDAGTATLKLFVNHWPSKKHPESFRMAAATTLATKLKTLPGGTDYLILGDFNSDYDEFASFTTSGHNDTRDRTGINHVLGTVAPAGSTFRMRTEREVIAAPFPSHFDPWTQLPAKNRMSYLYQGNRQTIDHILMPPSLFDSGGVSYLDNSFSAFTWDGKLLEGGVPVRWKLNYAGKLKYHVGEGYSDHLPVVARFTVRPFHFNTSVAAASADSGPAANGWFEFHNSGWIACANSVRIERDTIQAAAGRYRLRIISSILKNNETVARTIVRESDRGRNGDIVFSLRGSGSICFRTKTPDGKWRYHNLDDGTSSGRAKYVPVDYGVWRTVTLHTSAPAGENVELELRIGKGTTLDVCIDR